MTQRAIAILLGVVVLLGTSGCSEEDAPERNLVSDFIDYCYRSDVDLSEVRINARLVFDTLNLPSANAGINKLVMGIDPAQPFGNPPFLEFLFPEALPAEVDPGLAMQTGWKVSLRNVSASKCTTCYTNDGLARIVSLSGSIVDATFEYDPEDTLVLHITPEAVSEPLGAGR